MIRGIQLRVADLDQGVQYFEQLQFDVVRSTDQIAWAQDRACRIRLTSVAFDRTGLLIDGDVQGTPATEVNEKFVSLDPDGTRLVWNVPLPSGTSSVASILGNFAGISLEVLDLKTSSDFYQSLGLEVSMGSIDQGWISLTSRDSLDLSLMRLGACPHLFVNPSLTYFNGESNRDVIKNLRSNGVSIAEEVTVFNPGGEVDNIVLQAPGRLGFFVFSD